MKIKSKKWMEREKLKLWRNLVLTRDDFKCQICYSKPNKPNIHHIIPKQVKELRYDVMNGITLCYNHHKVGVHSPHMNALWFFIWFRDIYCKDKSERFNYLMDKLK